MTEFERIRTGILHSYDGTPRGSNGELLDFTPPTVSENVVLDGTCIPHADRWRQFVDVTTYAMPSIIGGFVCNTVYGG